MRPLPLGPVPDLGSFEPSLDYLRSLPATSALRADLAVLRQELADYDTEHQAPPVRLVGRVKRLEHQLPLAERRDAVQATRPDGCWCLGAGGTGERAVLVAGDEVPLVLSTYCTCPEAADRERADVELRDRARQYAQQVDLQAVWREAQIPERFNRLTLDSYPVTPRTEKAVQRVREWADSPEWALVLWGDFGVGKTGLGVGLLRAAADRRKATLFVKVPDLLARIRATFGRDGEGTEMAVLQTIRQVPWLVLDDLGTEKATDWATSVLFQVIDDRHDSERKTVITTNLSVPDELAMHLGERTMRRLEEGARFVRLDGPNLRREKSA